MKKLIYLGAALLTFSTVTACSGNEDKTDNNEEQAFEGVQVDTIQFLAELEVVENKMNSNLAMPKEKDMKEALSKYQDFASIFPDNKKSPDYLLKASDLALTLNQPEKSVKLLNRIIENYENYSKMEDVKYNRASHLDFELRDTTAAKEAYKEFIELYPNSALIPDCHSRIANIRYSMEELTEKFMKDLEENGGTETPQ